MPREIIVKSTRDQIKDFKKSFLWEDINVELSTWKEGFEQEMLAVVDDVADNNPSSASVLIHLGDVSGRIRTINYLLSLPDIFLQILEDTKDDNKCE